MKTSSFLGVLVALAAVTFPARGEGGHHHGDGPRPGRYVGNITYPDRGFRIPVQIDFTKMDHGDYAKLSAVVKLMPGGPGSGEYLAYYYPEVLSMEQKLTLGDSENDLRAAELTLFSDTVSGDVTSVSGGAPGKLWVSQVTADEEEPDIDEPGDEEPIVVPFKGDGSLPILPRISGDLTGSCGDKKALLGIDAARGLLASTTASFDYALSARLSVEGRCSGAYCLERGYPAGVLRLFLFDRDALDWGGLACRVTATGVSCRTAAESCEFARKSPQAEPWKAFRRLAHVNRTSEERKPLPTSPAPADLQGTFSGYLHDEAHDTYQLVELEVDAYEDSGFTGGKALQIGAEAKIFLGKKGESEALVERFAYRPFIAGGTTLTLEGSSGSLLRILSWTKGFVRAVWHEKSFGRVGTLEVVRGRVPPRSAEMKALPTLSGRYEGEKGSLELAVTPRQSLDVATLLAFSGKAAGREIRGGSFDPFTGAVALELENGTRLTGTLGDQGLMLSWPVDVDAAPGTVVGPSRPTLYRRR